jgi:hypothetical protein
VRTQAGGVRRRPRRRDYVHEDNMGESRDMKQVGFAEDGPCWRAERAKIPGRKLAAKGTGFAENRTSLEEGPTGHRAFRGFRQ